MVAQMVRTRYYKSCCILALLIAQGIQAATPDLASLASTRLFLILEAIAERVQAPANAGILACWYTFHAEKVQTQNGSIPLRESSEESASDEVCLASCQRPLLLSVENVRIPHRARFGPSRSEQFWVQSHHRLNSFFSGSLPLSPTLIRSLCRLTC
jgi:hypothetical protein